MEKRTAQNNRKFGKKNEQNKPILVEKPTNNEKSRPILISKVNKFEEKTPVNPPKVVETPLIKTEPSKINEPIKENEITNTPISTPKTNEELKRAE
jgi:hypothetical protein